MMTKADFFARGRLTKIKARPEPIRRAGSDSSAFNSLGSGIGNAIKQPIPEYTGTEMIGIGQLHKSNAVPVFRNRDIHDLGKMRR